MNSRRAFIFALLLTLLIASNVYLLTNVDQKEKNVLITRVIDGDTIEINGNVSVRLVNINSPEKSDPNSEIATDFLKQYQNKTVQIEVLGLDKYRRTLARVYAPDYLNLQIVEQGLATKFLVHNGELDAFSLAEKRAIDSEKGIWKKSKDFGCFKTIISQKKEIVEISNLCAEINLQGFWLRDESRKKYKFGKTISRELKLHTRDGNDTNTELFWGEKTEAWNDDRDSLYIFDSENKLAHYETYGY